MRPINTITTTVNTLINNTIDNHANDIINIHTNEQILDIQPNIQDEQEPIFL